MRGARTLQAAVRALRSRFVEGAIILLYHRIADPSNDPFSMNVSPGRFAEHLQAIRRIGQPISLNQLVEGLKRRSVRRGAIVVTFDDGYADNLHVARPLLERYEVPATVFVTSGLIGLHGECWWDALARMVLGAREPSGPLRLVIEGMPRVLRHRKPKRMLGAIHRLLRMLDEESRKEALTRVSAWAGIDASTAVVAHPTLARSEVRTLIASPLIDVGAHTLTHPVLSALGTSAARQELQGAKAALERTLDRPVTSLAFPYGQASDYSKETMVLARECGYHCACTAIPDIVRGGSDPFQLPRLWVGDWSSEILTRRLSRWLHD